jgi:predicted flap endonuclease-1-like 5' DNA nuclease
MLRNVHLMIEEAFMKSSLFQTPPPDDRAPWWLFWLLVIIAVLALLAAWWASRRKTPAVDAELIEAEPLTPVPVTDRSTPVKTIEFDVVAPITRGGAEKAARVTPVIPEPVVQVAANEPVSETRPKPAAEIATEAVPAIEEESKELAEPVRFESAIIPEVTPAAPDDLTKIEGIGLKISSWLKEAGIITFAQLAATPPEKLEEILLNAGHRITNPGTWPEQAALAAAGKWAEFETLQDNLHGGRRK